MTNPISILIVDDHAIVREGLRTLLSEEADLLIIGEATNGHEALEMIATLSPQVVLMDVVMPGLDGIQTTKKICANHPTCKVLILTTFAEDRRVHDAIQAGAIGYLLKDILKTDLLRAIQAAAHGEPSLHPEAQRRLIHQITNNEQARLNTLTEREQDVLRLIVQGASNKEIGGRLHLTEGTVKGYVSAILLKLEVADRTQAALYAVKHGFARL